MDNLENEKSIKLNGVIDKMKSQGVKISKVKRISKALYKFLEHDVENTKPERPVSKDYLELMHIALDSDDQEWFKQLSATYAELVEDENYARELLGFTGTF